MHNREAGERPGGPAPTSRVPKACYWYVVLTSLSRSENRLCLTPWGGRAPSLGPVGT